MVVAIDGPGGVGKSTVSARTSQALGLAHLDTGSFYRAATLAVLRAGIDPEDESAVLDVVASVSIDFANGEVWLDNADVTEATRSDEVTAAVSAVSAIPELRADLVNRQRDWVERHGGSAVVEGRDIGTVVFPDAAVKVFLAARPEVRAARRAKDKGDREINQIAAELRRRDSYDSQREVSPLRAADDAVVVDTSDLDIDQVVERVLELAIEAGAGTD
jgi:cytidylate kinase